MRGAVPVSNSGTFKIQRDVVYTNPAPQLRHRPKSGTKKPLAMTAEELSRFVIPLTWLEIVGGRHDNASLKAHRWRELVMRAENEGLLQWLPGETVLTHRGLKNLTPGRWTLTDAGREMVKA